MADGDAAGVRAHHTGEGVAQRAAFHDRLRTERDNLEAEGTALQPEVTNVEEMSAADVLDGVDKVDPMYQLLPKAETKTARRNNTEMVACATSATSRPAASNSRL